MPFLLPLESAFLGPVGDMWMGPCLCMCMCCVITLTAAMEVNEAEKL